MQTKTKKERREDTWALSVAVAIGELAWFPPETLPKAVLSRGELGEALDGKEPGKGEGGDEEGDTADPGDGEPFTPASKPCENVTPFKCATDKGCAMDPGP